MNAADETRYFDAFNHNADNFGVESAVRAFNSLAKDTGNFTREDVARWAESWKNDQEEQAATEADKATFHDLDS